MTAERVEQVEQVERTLLWACPRGHLLRVDEAAQAAACPDCNRRVYATTEPGVMLLGRGAHLIDESGNWPAVVHLIAAAGATLQVRMCPHDPIFRTGRVRRPRPRAYSLWIGCARMPAEDANFLCGVID